MKTERKEKQEALGCGQILPLSDFNLLHDPEFSYDYQPHDFMAESVSQVIVLTELKSLELDRVFRCENSVFC